MVAHEDGRDWLNTLSQLRGEEYAEQSEYPINGAELARRLLTADETRAAMFTRDEYKLVQYRVRNKLRQLGCPKQSRVASLRLGRRRGHGRTGRRRARLSVDRLTPEPGPVNGA